MHLVQSALEQHLTVNNLHLPEGGLNSWPTDYEKTSLPPEPQRYTISCKSGKRIAGKGLLPPNPPTQPGC